MAYVGRWFSKLFGLQSVEAGEEEKVAFEKITALKKSLEEGQNVSGIIEMRYKALIQAASFQMMAKYEQEKALQYGEKHCQHEGSFADEAPEVKVTFESLQGGMMDAIQMNKDWIKRLEQQIDELLKPLGKEKQKPVHHNSELNEDYETKKSNTNETKERIKSDPSSRKKPGLAQKRQVVSLLYCPQKVDLVVSVMKQLDEMLSTHLSAHGIDFKMQICEAVQDIHEDIPLIVICLHSSRLGTDVSNAIKGMRTSPNVAVMVLHHKDIHALPSTSSNKILTAQEFQRVGVIVDMGFLSQKGFYPCDMNNKAIEALTSFITGRSGM